MHKLAFAALCAATMTAGWSARADTFVLTNTRHDDCHERYGVPALISCDTTAGNGVGAATINGGSLSGPDLDQPFGVVSNTTTLTAIAENDETLIYDWDYFSLDTISSAFDPAGYVLGGNQTQLTDGSGNDCDPMFLPNACFVVLHHQTGEITFNISAGQSYGFYVFSGDSAEGSGNISWKLVSANMSAAPEPASWGLMLIGFASLGAALRRGRAAVTV